jgi:hypothetical protein
MHLIFSINAVQDMLNFEGAYSLAIYLANKQVTPDFLRKIAMIGDSETGFPFRLDYTPQSSTRSSQVIT